ncbi:MAG: DegV family protein [Butyricicoccaceae bacterium]
MSACTRSNISRSPGRISGGAAFVGEALGLKPISFVYDGAVKVCDKVRGEKALAAGICKKVVARVQQPEKQTGILLYGDVPEERLAEVEKRMRARRSASRTSSAVRSARLFCPIPARLPSLLRTTARRASKENCEKCRIFSGFSAQNAKILKTLLER